MTHLSPEWLLARLFVGEVTKIFWEYGTSMSQMLSATSLCLNKERVYKSSLSQRSAVFFSRDKRSATLNRVFYIFGFESGFYKFSSPTWPEIPDISSPRTSAAFSHLEIYIISGYIELY